MREVLRKSHGCRPDLIRPLLQYAWVTYSFFEEEMRKLTTLDLCFGSWGQAPLYPLRS
jgi:hypothetical protein